MFTSVTPVYHHAAVAISIATASTRRHPHVLSVVKLSLLLPQMLMLGAPTCLISVQFCCELWYEQYVWQGITRWVHAAASLWQPAVSRESLTGRHDPREDALGGAGPHCVLPAGDQWMNAAHSRYAPPFDDTCGAHRRLQRVVPQQGRDTGVTQQRSARNALHRCSVHLTSWHEGTLAVQSRGPLLGAPRST